MKAIGQDTLKTRRTLNVQGKSYDYFSLTEAAKALGDISRLPVSSESAAGERAALRGRHQLQGR